MVCSLNLESQALCCVADPSNGTHVAFHFPMTNLVGELFEEVGRRLRYDPASFELSANVRIGETLESVVLNNVKERSLNEVGLRPGPDVRNTIALLPLKKGEIMKQTQDTLVIRSEDLAVKPSAAGDLGPPPEPPPEPPAPTPAVIHPSNASRYPSVTQYGEVPSSSAVPYVGLVNQAMTCYLNSLLQALFMTPEFRNALYHWEYDGSREDESKSMPYQLQKLFLNLQTSSRSSVETTALTRSFGWDSSEAWQQHDIQELCRVMFDALEQKFKDTDQADLINRLYEGTMTDYVKCLECSTEKHREDKFLDIPLPVRPFGSAVAYGSVEEALRAFVQPETLEGNNQYHCERCSKKCDAHKGLKFTKFPYLLTLHLKRFDFDYNTLNRIKLNDKVTFPEKINLNGFIPSATEGETPVEAVEETVKCDDSSTTDSGSALDEDTAGDTPSASNHTDYQEDDEGIDLSNAHESEKNRFNAADSGEAGPYIYELFSIMIHSGSASGGHYYAYIKDFNLGEWFCFNDQSVSRITYEDIRKTYGGGRGYYSGAYSSSTNAYMLMYRQVDRERNATAMTTSEFPPHLHELLRRIEEQKEIDARQREREVDLVRLKCFYQPPDQPMQDFRLCISRDSTLSYATREAHQCANLEASVPLELCRLVAYDRAKDSIESSFEGKEEESISTLLGGLYKNDVLLEVRGKDEQFKVHRPGDINTKVLVISATAEEVEGPLTVRGNMDASVDEYRQAVAQALQSKIEETHILLEKYSSDPTLLIFNRQPLRVAGFFSNVRVFALTGPLPDMARVSRIAARAKHIVTLHVTLPVVTKEALEELNLHSAEEALGACRLDGPGGDHDRECDSSPQPLPDPEDPLTGPPSDQSASEDSSLTDSERTIVGDAPGQSPGVSPGGSPVAWEHNTSSPENEPVDQSQELTWAKHLKQKKTRVRRICFKSSSRDDDDDDDVEPWYFHATPYQENNVSMLRVLADKRMPLRQLKDSLQPYVGVSVDYFKVFRVSNGQDSECVRPTETLKMSREEDHLTVRLGRALRKGECAGKVYLLDLKNPESDKFLVEWVIAANASVAAVKREVLAEVKRKCSIDIPLNRCRLRLKKWTEPSIPYQDDAFFSDITSNWELYLQELDGPEPFIDQRLLLFVRQWCPSSFELRPLVEVVLTSMLVSELKQKITELSEIPVENLAIAKGKGHFPCIETNLRRIHSDLEWNSDAVQLDEYPLHVSEFGAVIYYRDNTEKLKVMSHEERKELVSGEDRVRGVGLRAFSQKKERALKIYVDSSPPRRRDENEVD